MNIVNDSDVLLLMGTLIFLVLSNIGAGFVIWKKTTGEKNIPSHAISFFLGQVVISLLSIIISTLFNYPLNRTLIILLLIPLFVYGLIQIKPQLLKKKRTVRFSVIVLLPVLLVFIGINFAHSFIPSTGWDEVVYHEPVVREISRGSVRYPLLKDSPFVNFYVPFTEFYGNFPYSSEAYAAVGYMFSGQLSVTSLLYFINFVALLLFVSWALKAIFKTDIATRLAILILLSTSYNIVLLLSTSYIDINVAIYQFIAIILALWGINKQKLAIIVPSLVIVGYSLGMKYTSFLFFPFYLAFLLIELHNKRNFREARKYIKTGFLLMVLAGGYWYAKNFLLYQNPIYPFVFGHKGLSEEIYNLIIDTQAFLRFPKDIPGLLQAIKTNTFVEPFVVISFLLMLFSLIFNKDNKSILIKHGKYLFILAISLYLSNFYFANQSFRYVLVVPIIFYFLLSQYIKKNSLFSFLTVAVVITSIVRSPSLRDVWQSRMVNIVLVSSGNYESFYVRNMGCAWNVADIVRSNPTKEAKAVNFWDPYASVFFKDEGLFYNYSQVSSSENLSFPGNIKYYYINKSYKEGFLSKPDFHRGLELDKREDIEEELIENATLVFQNKGCLLYKIG